MATHFAKFKGLKNNFTTNTELPKKYMEQMIVRKHVDKTKNMHPSVKARWNQMTQEPKPFKFGLHPMEAVREAQGLQMKITSEHLQQFLQSSQK